MKTLNATSCYIPAAFIGFVFAAAVSVSAAAVTTLVVCAPGYPGSTLEAQPAMDGLADAMVRAADWPEGSISAAYFESENEGLERIGKDDAGLVLLTLPMYLKHRIDLGLKAHLQVQPTGRTCNESWTLVAGKDLVKVPEDLAGWEILSLAGHAPTFVRGPALGGWGVLSDSTTIIFSGKVLSGLRRASRGEHVALLLDGQQFASLERLPFAKDLEAVYHSPSFPVSLVCTVGNRLKPDRVHELITALMKLDSDGEAASAMAGVRLERFTEVDPDALENATTAFDSVTK